MNRSKPKVFNWSVLDTRRSPITRCWSRSRKSGGLALIYNNNITTRLLKISTSFERQLVSIQVGHITVKDANICCQPMCSKATFLDEFAEMLTLIERRLGEKLICGDFNKPRGEDINDDRLSTLASRRAWLQAAGQRGNNLLDLIITPTSSPWQQLVSNVNVVSSYTTYQTTTWLSATCRCGWSIKPLSTESTEMCKTFTHAVNFEQLNSSDVVLEDRPWPQGSSRTQMCVLGLGLGLEGPGLGLGLGLMGPGLGLVLGLWILALTTTLFITNIAASLKASTFNNYVYP